MASVLPTKYAQALLDLMPAASEAELGAALGQLRQFSGVYSEFAELRSALTSPAVPVATRKRIIAVLVERLQLSDLMRRFLMVICEHGRTSLISAIADGFEELMDARLGRVTADVAVAALPSAAQQEAIRTRLAVVTGKQVRVRFELQGDLIGGFRATIGSTVYDASVKGQFDALRRRLGEVA